MRFLLSVVFLLLLQQTRADAGFNVSRKKAVSIVKVGGTEHLIHSKLVLPESIYDTTNLRPWEKKGKVIDNNFEMSVQEGGRHWEEIERQINFILIDTATGNITDSIHLFAKDFNLSLSIDSEKNGRLQYHIDSSKALYQYTLVNEATPDQFAGNRYIFIACSVAGLLLLIIFFIRKKNKTANTSL